MGVLGIVTATDKMSNWARRMHRRAATLSSVVTSCGHPDSLPYPRRLEKVKFGVPLHEVCKDDIPGPLLVSIQTVSLNILAYVLWCLEQSIFCAGTHFEVEQGGAAS